MAIQTPIRGLRSFCIAARCLSFKHAAEQLHISASAVSHQIRQLETQLDKQLFRRHTRAIELTAEGKAFHQALWPLIEQLEKTISDFTISKDASPITIRLPEFFASEIFVPKLPEWSEQNPSINLQLETVNKSNDAANTADLSIVLASSKPSDAVIYDLFPISYVPACSPTLYKKLKPLGTRALFKVPLILHQSRPWAWHHWAEASKIEEFEPSRIVQVDSMFSVARAAQQGLGIALIPLPNSQSWFDEGAVLPLFHQSLHTKDSYYLIQHDWRAPRHDLNLFVQWILSTFSK